MQSDSKRLNTTDHSRDSAGLTYVYPVISRRAGGVSIGINLNPNNACNWRCVYCQVPDLKRGSAPRIDLNKLERELRSFLHELVDGDFMQKHVPPEVRKIHDIAISGNGEPTSAKEFEHVIELIGNILKDFNALKGIKLVLITNGSLINRQPVQAGLKRMAQLNGEVWFKFDRALAEERQRINNTSISLKKIHRHLQIVTSLCPTWLQTCVFQINGTPPSELETNAYLKFVSSLKDEGLPLKGVLLYGIARPSLQPEAAQLSQVTESWLIAYGEKIKALGLAVKLNP
ncbi:radical SAM protein [Nitrosomonas sp.]|uniref:radical SAM protein n=1 Tax=Nitrosomonas sp. TaxID=42353 RepID=UPI00273161F7|nr:radical SAM protein [Nitrosomonas sp.]MDP1786075.1 radical SAM protein [Nitrosomonas sp.]MDP2223106.1 radical SAM protein [Nitrosomonas sp.]